jgi:hypothetical protein
VCRLELVQDANQATCTSVTKDPALSTDKPKLPRLIVCPSAPHRILHADDAFLDNFVKLLAVLQRAGKLEAKVDFNASEGKSDPDALPGRSLGTMLRGVLAARPVAVARTRGQMDAALHAIEAQEHPLPAANALAERAVQSLCADNLAAIEATMDAVGSALRDDPAAAAIVAQMLVPTGTRIDDA